MNPQQIVTMVTSAASVVFAIGMVVLWKHNKTLRSGRPIRSDSTVRPPRSTPTFIVVAGCIALVAGFVALLLGSEGTPTTALLGGGIALIALSYLGPSVTSLKFGNTEIMLRQVEFIKDLRASGRDELADEFAEKLPTQVSSLVNPAFVQDEAYSDEPGDLEDLLARNAPKGATVRHRHKLTGLGQGRPMQPTFTLTDGVNRLAVEVLRGRTTAAVQHRLEALRRNATSAGGRTQQNTRFIIAADDEAFQTIEKLAETTPLPDRLSLVHWGTTQDHDAVKQAISRVFK